MSELALMGGNPVRKSLLPYGRQSISQDDINAVITILKGEFLTTGPSVKQFEEKVANYVGSRYAVAVSNGTAALHMACFAAGITLGDEVIVSPMTFAASVNCVLYCGGKPIFADIDPKTLNIDPDKIQSKITSRTKAIIPVDFTGQSVDIEKIMNIAREHNLIVIEDAAHALGSEFKSKKIGAISDMTMFSFHPVKPITTGEGGIITTDNHELYNRMIQFRTHGICRNPEQMGSYDGPWYYEQQILGFNYRLTDIQCVLGSSQMDRIDSFIQRRREIAKSYNIAFKEIQQIITPYEAEYSNSGWHLYVISLVLDSLNATRKDIFQALLAENIGVNVHYIPVYFHPYYKRLGYQVGECPNAEYAYQRIITLPLFPSMSNSDINDVIEAVKKVINYFKK